MDTVSMPHQQLLSGDASVAVCYAGGLRTQWADEEEGRQAGRLLLCTYAALDSGMLTQQALSSILIE